MKEIDHSLLSSFYLFYPLSPIRELAENITNFIVEKIEEELENKIQLFATKGDLANTKADIIKWMFIFWVGQVLATFGFILLFLKQ